MGKGKGKKKKVRRSEDNDLKSDQSYTDFLCPICLEILIQPVQMPCKHELCMECFKTHVYSTSLTCPMCRLRISIWARKNTKTQTLVNEERWNLIQKMFPERVQRRIDGHDDFEESFKAPVHIIANEGELRKEYEEELKRLEAEDNEDINKSMDYIRNMKGFDFVEQLKQIEMDEAAAKSLQEEEMKNLGVKIKSPSSYQKEILEMFRPKSPMRLRSTGTSSSNKRKFTLSSSALKSPTHQSIKSFFQSTPDEACSSKRCSSTHTKTKHAASNSINISLDDDYDLAKQLQDEFDAELTIHNNSLNIDKNESINTSVPSVNPISVKKGSNGNKHSATNSKLTSHANKQVLQKSTSTLNNNNKRKHSSTSFMNNYVKVTKISTRDSQVTDENSPVIMLS